MEAAEFQELDFVIKTVGSLPLLRGFIERMGFARLIDMLVPWPCMPISHVERWRRFWSSKVADHIGALR